MLKSLTRQKPVESAANQHCLCGRSFASLSTTSEVPMTPLNVLLVAPNPHVAATVLSALSAAGCRVMVVGSFAEAKMRIAENPSLLIADLRLGDYNGLHLAMRARAANIPAMVIGPPDVVLERDAAQIGAAYLTYATGRAELLSVAFRLCAVVPGNIDLPAGAPPVSFISWDEVAAAKPYSPRAS
jgi:CheY-like chemotaxis protein